MLNIPRNTTFIVRTIVVVFIVILFLVGRGRFRKLSNNFKKTMELNWITYGLLWMLALGLGDFMKKMILEHGWNKEVFLLVCFILYVPIFWWNMLFQWTGIFDTLTVQSWIILGITNFFVPIWIMVSLKYLDASFSIVAIRLISSFLVLFIGIYILWDQLSLYNIVWFIIGAIALFLLSWFRLWDRIKIHPKWVIGICMAIAWVVFWNAYFKYIVPDINVHDFMPIQFTTTLLSLIFYIVVRRKVWSITKASVMKVLPYSGITALIFVVYFLYLIPNIYLLGPLSLGYKILSYSLIVPVILSIIFFWDPLGKRRIIAFVLTIISIFLFLI